MSRNINGVPVIYDEPDDICELCGKVDEVRPYGPKGERICFDCGKKDPKTTDRMMGKVLFGESIQ
jgi:hypothetical protein